MSDVRFRPYTKEDRAACLALCDGNTPKYFAPEERQDFVDFLDDLSVLSGAYLVLERGDEIVGCCGYHVDGATGTASFRWGMAARSQHKTGLGKIMLKERIKRVKEHGSANRIQIDTSQLSAPFFAHFGFTTTSTVPDGFGPGIDHVAMELTL